MGIISGFGYLMVVTKVAPGQKPLENPSVQMGNETFFVQL
jgi:hypothetical protein